MKSSAQYINVLCAAFKTTFWPPSFRPNRYSTIDAIDSIKAVGPTPIKATCGHTEQKACVTAADYGVFIKELEKVGCGLCSMCVKEGKRDLVIKCERTEHVTWA